MLKSENPTVSVVMTAYNEEQFLLQAVDSILAQTLKEWELIVVDDSSSDSTSEILSVSADSDPRIRVVTNRFNLGRSGSAARGISLARAPFVARMDADDVSYPDRLAIQADFLLNNVEVDVVGSFADTIDENGIITGQRTVPTGHAEIRRNLWANPFLQPSVMFRRERIVSIGGYDTQRRFHDDYELWFRCGAADFGFANIPANLIQYRETARQRRKRRSWDWSVSHLLTGWAGCAMVHARPIAYLGVAYPVVRACLPHPIGAGVARMFARLDPRTSPRGT